MTEAEAAKAPEGMQMKDLNQMPGYKFAIVVSAFDCTGCGSCVNVCPDKVQAITMTGFEAHEDEQKYSITQYLLRIRRCYREIQT